LFLGSLRSVFIPVIAIPLSIVGTFFIMMLLGYSINLLTLLAFVLAIGLVVDDAIIIVENVHRHMEKGLSPLEAALEGTRELAMPIIAISVVLIAVYLPIGFMGGLTGTLFTEFAFTLAGAVGISAIIALTLSPMMCSKLMVLGQEKGVFGQFVTYLDNRFNDLKEGYHQALNRSLNHLPVIGVFALIIFVSIYFLFTTAKTELAPQEDEGVVISLLTAAPNATIRQTAIYSGEVYKILNACPEMDHIFQLDGINGVNSSIGGMVLVPWQERKRLTNVIQPELQQKLAGIAGANTVAFQPPPLPGAGGGLPVQFVIETTESFDRLNDVSQEILDKARASGMFIFIDTDLKFDKPQVSLEFDRDKTANLGLTMKDVGNALVLGLGGNYLNYFDLSGRSYKVIPQMMRSERLNYNQLLNYYITTPLGDSILLSTFATLTKKTVPQSLNHFQQLNSATISGVPFPGVTLGQALETLEGLAKESLPTDYSVDYMGESRQYRQESHSLIVTFVFALIIIFLALSALFESFRDPLIVLVSVPMSICGALIFISLGFGGASLNIYTEVGLVTLIGLISKHGILIVQFANDLQRAGKNKREAIELAAATRLRPILMTTAAMVLGVMPLIMATGAGAASRFNIGLVVATGISLGTLFTLFVLPGVYLYLAEEHVLPPNA
jgi:multidrug efflux pump